MPDPVPSAAPADAPTPQRILTAAAAEFAERGLAGARVDRIADRAHANKQRIYAYFGGKDELFDRVVEDLIDTLVEEVPFDAADLPGYAVALLDYNVAHPQWVRLLLWHDLERPGRLATLPRGVASTADKIEALRTEQAARPDRVDPTQEPERLLGQVLAVVHGATMLVVSAAVPGGGAPGPVRADVHHAVARIVAPPPAAPTPPSAAPAPAAPAVPLELL